MFNREKIDQKEQERVALKSFLGCMNLYEYHIEPCNPPNPDFIIENAVNKIGIEVSEYVNGVEKAKQKILNEIEENLRRKLNDKFLDTHYDILIRWNHHNKHIKFQHKKNRKELLENLIRYIQNHIPGDNEEHFIEYPTELKKYVFSIKIRRNDSIFKNNYVRSSNFGYLGCDNNIIDAIIQKKRLKLPMYKESINNIWLLIPSYEEDFYNYVDLDAVLKYKIKKSIDKDFDQIYFHQLNTKKVVDLFRNRVIGE